MMVCLASFWAVCYYLVPAEHHILASSLTLASAHSFPDTYKTVATLFTHSHFKE